MDWPPARSYGSRVGYWTWAELIDGCVRRLGLCFRGGGVIGFRFYLDGWREYMVETGIQRVQVMDYLGVAG